MHAKLEVAKLEVAKLEVAKLGVAKLGVAELEAARQEKLVRHTMGSADSACSVDTVDVFNSGEKKYEMLN